MVAFCKLVCHIKSLFIVFVILIISLFKGHTQKIEITITGKIKDVADSSINNAYIKVTNAKTKLILVYFNTGNQSSFSTNIICNSTDSLTISVSHVAYQTFIKSIEANSENSQLNLTIQMLAKANDLNNVTVNAPPVWVRGDTTFFKVNAFKHGDERRLEEILQKMPGFEIDENGNLFYKKKRVEKVMVDGEEIFADKVKMLINNFPIHVIDQVQALENQNANPLYKGLTNERKVFLNLSLNKSKIKAAFGNAEVGFGTLERYLIKPVVFSLYNKLKLAYVGNINSVGDGMTWQEELEQKPEQLKLNEAWLMRDIGFMSIGNFPNTRYINNKRFSNNIQISLPASKLLKQKLELSSITDRQSQITSAETSLLNDSFYISRKDSNQIINKPILLSAKYTLEQQLKEQTTLKTIVHYFFNGTNSNQNSNFSFENFNNATNNSIKNNWNYFSLNSEFTQRINEQKLVRLEAVYSFQNNPQSGMGISNNWQTLFQLNNSYNQLQQTLNFNTQHVKLVLEQVSKQANYTSTTGLTFNWQRFSSNNALAFTNNINSTTKDTLLQSFSNMGLYNFYSFKAKKNYALTLGKWKFESNNEVGCLLNNRKENIQLNKNAFPLLQFELIANTKIRKKLISNTTISFQQFENERSKNIGFLMPVGINQFNRNFNGINPLPKFMVTKAFATAWSKNRHISNLAVMYNRSFVSPVSTSLISGMLQFSVDSFINKPTQSISVNTTTTFNSFFSKNLYNVTFGMNLNENLIALNNSIIKTKQSYKYVLLNSKIYCTEKYFINSTVKYFNTRLQFPKNIPSNNLGNISSIVLELKQLFALGKTASLVLNTDYYNGNVAMGANAQLFFADIEFNIGYPKKHLFFYFKAENLFNQNVFVSSVFNVISQRISNIPLIGRNVLLTVKYEL